jgi:hypothetical protein
MQQRRLPRARCELDAWMELHQRCCCACDVQSSGSNCSLLSRTGWPPPVHASTAATRLIRTYRTVPVDSSAAVWPQPCPGPATPGGAAPVALGSLGSCQTVRIAAASRMRTPLECPSWSSDEVGGWVRAGLHACSLVRACVRAGPAAAAAAAARPSRPNQGREVLLAPAI